MIDVVVGDLLLGAFDEIVADDLPSPVDLLCPYYGAAVNRRFTLIVCGSCQHNDG